MFFDKSPKFRPIVDFMVWLRDKSCFGFDIPRFGLALKP